MPDKETLAALDALTRSMQDLRDTAQMQAEAIRQIAWSEAAKLPARVFEGTTLGPLASGSFNSTTFQAQTGDTEVITGIWLSLYSSTIPVPTYSPSGIVTVQLDASADQTPFGLTNTLSPASPANTTLQLEMGADNYGDAQHSVLISPVEIPVRGQTRMVGVQLSTSDTSLYLKCLIWGYVAPARTGVIH